MSKLIRVVPPSPRDDRVTWVVVILLCAGVSVLLPGLVDLLVAHL